MRSIRLWISSVVHLVEEDKPFTGRAALGYDHGYDGQIFYLGLALDPAYVEGFVEGCLERIGEDDPEEE